MYLIKGLLIFSPIFFYRLKAINLNPKLERILTLLFGLFILTVTFTDYSFLGWIIDYSIFFIGATFILKAFIAHGSRTLTIIIRLIVVLVFVGYVVLKSLFGPQLIDQYKKDGLSYRLYKIPDLVISPTKRLEVTQTYGPFEKLLFDEVVQPGKCRFEFDLTTNKLVTIENCPESK